MAEGMVDTLMLFWWMYLNYLRRRAKFSMGPHHLTGFSATHEVVDLLEGEADADLDSLVAVVTWSHCVVVLIEQHPEQPILVRLLQHHQCL